jgi:glycosyltransferase involved in cell wall biosynthesis
MVMDENNIKLKSVESELFSVILLHYNQQQYIKQSLNSIFEQNYPNIELIIADDCSIGDLNWIKEYVDENKTRNIKNVRYQFNEKNVGTVKNVNQAIRKVNGKYAMLFAADDILFNEGVLSYFHIGLNKLEDNQYMVAAQCHMMDVHMINDLGLFNNAATTLEMNNLSATEQFMRLASKCTYAMGATAFKTEMFEEKGYFDESFKIIEDWTYYLFLTLSGSKIIYNDFDALKHRAGGVSHYDEDDFPPHVIEYKNDLLISFEKFILPNLFLFEFEKKIELYNTYNCMLKDFRTFKVDKSRMSQFEFIRKNKYFYFRKIIRDVKDRNKNHIIRSFNISANLLSTWVILRFIKYAEQGLLPLGNQFTFFNSKFFSLISSSFITNTLLVLYIISLAMFIAFVALGIFCKLHKSLKKVMSIKRK